MKPLVMIMWSGSHRRSPHGTLRKGMLKCPSWSIVTNSRVAITVCVHYHTACRYSVIMAAMVHTIDYVELRKALTRCFSPQEYEHGYAPCTYDVDTFTDDIRTTVDFRTRDKRVEQHALLVIDQLIAAFKIALDTHNCKTLTLAQVRDVVTSGMACALESYPSGWRTENMSLPSCSIHSLECSPGECTIYDYVHSLDCLEAELREHTFLFCEEGKDQRYITLDDFKLVVSRMGQSLELPVFTLKTFMLNGANEEQINHQIPDLGAGNALSCILLRDACRIGRDAFKGAIGMRAPLWECSGASHGLTIPTADDYADTIKQLLRQSTVVSADGVGYIKMTDVHKLYWETFKEVINPVPGHSDRRVTARVSFILRYYNHSMYSRGVDGTVSVFEVGSWFCVQWNAPFEPAPRCSYDACVYDELTSAVFLSPTSIRKILTNLTLKSPIDTHAHTEKMPVALREQIMSDVMNFCLSDDGDEVDRTCVIACALYRIWEYYDISRRLADEKPVYTCKRKQGVRQCHVCDKHVEPSDRRATRIEWRYGSDHYVCSKPCLDKYVTHDCCTGLPAPAGMYNDVRDDPLLIDRKYIVKKVAQ